jgi:leucyl/phenylalanyl-tRNA--protein transferase
MPIFRLTNDIVFPQPTLASQSGILAVGGDLSPERLLTAYRQGIFPWFSEGEPIIWWSPDPRCILLPEKLKVSRSMKQVLRKGIFHVTYDCAFKETMLGCRDPRKDQDSTWITKDMMLAYGQLHTMGYAHSVEVWMDGSLAGGLYGVSLGACFFGESMFTRVSNASKAAFITLVKDLKYLGFSLIDCQISTEHLLSLGAEMIPRAPFMKLLAKCLQQPTLQGNWGKMNEFMH